MIGIVVVAHGGLAAEMLRAAEHVVGPLAAARAVGLGPKDDLSERRAEIDAALEEVDVGHGVIVLTDLFGGTPSNLAIAGMVRPNVDVVTGVNLPMMIKLAKARELPLGEAVSATVAAGRKHILDAAEVLGDDPQGRASS